MISDGLYNSTAELVIDILDMNDTPPVFLNTPYIVAVSAEAEIGKTHTGETLLETHKGRHIVRNTRWDKHC